LSIHSTWNNFKTLINQILSKIDIHKDNKIQHTIASLIGLWISIQWKSSFHSH